MEDAAGEAALYRAASAAFTAAADILETGSCDPLLLLAEVRTAASRMSLGGGGGHSRPPAAPETRPQSEWTVSGTDSGGGAYSASPAGAGGEVYGEAGGAAEGWDFAPALPAKIQAGDASMRGYPVAAPGWTRYLAPGTGKTYLYSEETGAWYWEAAEGGPAAQPDDLAADGPGTTWREPGAPGRLGLTPRRAEQWQHGGAEQPDHSEAAATRPPCPASAQADATGWVQARCPGGTAPTVQAGGVQGDPSVLERQRAFQLAFGGRGRSGGRGFVGAENRFGRRRWLQMQARAQSAPTPRPMVSPWAVQYTVDVATPFAP